MRETGVVSHAIRFSSRTIGCFIYGHTIFISFAFDEPTPFLKDERLCGELLFWSECMVGIPNKCGLELFGGCVSHVIDGAFFAVRKKSNKDSLPPAGFGLIEFGAFDTSKKEKSDFEFALSSKPCTNGFFCLSLPFVESKFHPRRIRECPCYFAAAIGSLCVTLLCIG